MIFASYGRFSQRNGRFYDTIHKMIREKDPPHIFASLPHDIETKLRSMLREHTFKAGESIFVQGEKAEAVYLVTSGLVKVERVSREGYQCVLCVRQAGDYFCPVPLLDHGEQLGTAVAISDTTIYSFDQTKFNNLCLECPALLAMVQGDCLKEVRRLLTRFETFAFRTIKERLAITLLREVRQHTIYNTSPDEIRLTQKDIAGLVGASRERVSRILKEFERKGIVTLKRGRIILRDYDFLKNLAKET